MNVTYHCSECVYRGLSEKLNIDYLEPKEDHTVVWYKCRNGHKFSVRTGQDMPEKPATNKSKFQDPPTELPAQEDLQIITVVQDNAEAASASKVGTDEFVATLLKELNTGKLWRTVASLATQLHVDAVELDKWLGSNPDFIRKPGKEDGVYYYCFTPRFNREVPQPAEKKAEPRAVVREEDRYALAMLHMIYWNLWKTLKTYALEVNERDEEAFKFFTSALDKLESGLVLYSGKTKASLEKLPKFS